MDDKELNEIEQRANAATIGPWKLFSTSGVTEITGNDGLPVINWGGFDDSDRTQAKHEANANFIAAARTDIPALVAEVRDLRRQLERARAALAVFADITNYRQDIYGVLTLDIPGHLRPWNFASLALKGGE